MISARDIDSLVIMRGPEQAGILGRTLHGCTFTFDPDFLARSSLAGLSLCLPKSRDPVAVHGTNLHPFFAGLLPEGLRLRVLRDRIKTSDDDLFSLFAAAGGNVIGDVHVKPAEPNGAEPFCPRLTEIDFQEFFFKLLDADSYGMGEDAIAGVQEKISASMINLPVRFSQDRASYILKLNPRDKPTLVENEYWCLRLAAKCGLAVPFARLVEDKNGHKGLLVRRFDRIFDEKKKNILMCHQEDACQFLDLYPADKYRISLNDIAHAFQQHIPAARAATLNLLQYYCFSYMLGNGDQHAKNISVLTTPAEVFPVLAPAYDLICTLLYGDRKMALKIDGRDDNIRWQTITGFAKRFGIPIPAVETMLTKLVRRFAKHRHILEAIPMDARARTFLGKTITKRLHDLEPGEKDNRS